MVKQWEEIRSNPPENWRDTWNSRKKVSRHDTNQQAERFISKYQHKYSDKLLIDIHPKDGYVVYYD